VLGPEPSILLSEPPYGDIQKRRSARLGRLLAVQSVGLMLCIRPGVDDKSWNRGGCTTVRTEGGCLQMWHGLRARGLACLRHICRGLRKHFYAPFRCLAPVCAGFHPRNHLLYAMVRSDAEMRCCSIPDHRRAEAQSWVYSTLSGSRRSLHDQKQRLVGPCKVHSHRPAYAEVLSWSGSLHKASVLR
jgi:hypothetical protein